MPDEQREGLAQAIVYPIKTKPTGTLKKQSSCGDADALHQGVIACGHGNLMPYSQFAYMLGK